MAGFLHVKRSPEMSPVPPQVPQERIIAAERPVRVVLEQGGRIGRWGVWVPWILFVVALFFAISSYSSYRSYMQRDPNLEERYFSHSPDATDKIAIITIEGPIMHNDGFAKWQID